MQLSARNRVQRARWLPRRSMKSAVANIATASLSSISVASCSPVSRPDSGTTQAPARMMPKSDSSISGPLFITTTTRSPGLMPELRSRAAKWRKRRPKVCHDQTRSSQTMAGFSPNHRDCRSIRSGSSGSGASKCAVVIIDQRNE